MPTYIRPQRLDPSGYSRASPATPSGTVVGIPAQPARALRPGEELWPAEALAYFARLIAAIESYDDLQEGEIVELPINV